MAGGIGGAGGGGNNQQNDKIRHPPSKYDTKYPMNRVTVTESGHEFHWDDTPGSERVRIAHMSGSYSEWGPQGQRVEMVTGNKVSYYKGGHTITADRNVDHKYNGSMRESISGHCHREAMGTVSSAIGGNSKHIIGGSMTTAVKGDQTHAVVGSTTYKAGKDAKVKFDSKLDLKADGASTLQFNQTLQIYSKGNQTQTTDGTYTFESKGNADLKAPQFKWTCGGVTMTLSGSGLAIQGGSVTHNDVNIGYDHHHQLTMPGIGQSGTPVGGPG